MRVILKCLDVGLMLQEGISVDISEIVEMVMVIWHVLYERFQRL